MKYFLLSVTLLFSTSLNAVEINLGDYKNRADVNQFIERMAWQSDYTESELIELFSAVKKQSHLFELLDKPAEKELEGLHDIDRSGIDSSPANCPSARSGYRDPGR